MKIFSALSVVTAATTAFVCIQPPDGDHPEPPRDPFFQLFDTDQDGEISMKEIDAAAAVLRKRDRDGSGFLTPDELPRPPRPPRPPHHGGRDFDGDRRGDRPGPPPPRDEPHGRQRPAVEEESDAVPGTVLIRGGHETDPRDGGRPVALIAAALGVKEQVFRDAFSNVRPSRFGPPTASRAQANKKVLMDALGKHGITNDRLDEVSNFYRYRPEAGELWTVKPASAKAVITDGKVTACEIVDHGSGYSSPPVVTIAGYPDVRVTASIEFDGELRTNGRIAKLTVVAN